MTSAADSGGTPPGALVAIGLGANLGDRRGALRRAAFALQDVMADIRWSSLYESLPREHEDQPLFLNACCSGRTTHAPERLLEVLHELEREAGRCRRRARRYGPRVLDLDLLLYGDLILETEELTIPHPRLTERAFVLIPLSEIAPSWRVAGSDLSVDALRGRLPEQGVRQVASAATWLGVEA